MSEGTCEMSVEARGEPLYWDAVAAVLMLVLVAPLMAAIYGAVLASGQAPIFRQDRVGYRERMFTILKFRTIPQEGWDAFESSARPWQVALYRRTAGLMRATGLDELPQLWNVLRGEMRFIGPRPLTREDFEALPDFRRLRCAGLPGITGLAQVNGGQALDPASKLLLDIYQLECMGIRLWATIALRSAGRILGFTSLVAVPCPVTLDRAKTAVAQRLKTVDMVTYTRLENEVFKMGPRLDGSVT